MSDKNQPDSKDLFQKNTDRDKGKSIISVTLLYSFFKPYLINLLLASVVLVTTAGISLINPNFFTTPLLTI